jgi:hypothetical protein
MENYRLLITEVKKVLPEATIIHVSNWLDFNLAQVLSTSESSRTKSNLVYCGTEEFTTGITGTRNANFVSAATYSP